MDLLLISISLQRGYFYLENIHKILLCKHHFKLELTNELFHGKYFFLTIVKNLTGLKCAPSKDSDQPAHSHSRIRVFAERTIASSAIQNAPREDSDQAARMRRLTSIFAGRTCTKVGFLTFRLIQIFRPWHIG